MYEVGRLINFHRLWEIVVVAGLIKKVKSDAKYSSLVPVKLAVVYLDTNEVD